jgi:PAP2 superfamily
MHKLERTVATNLVKPVEPHAVLLVMTLAMFFLDTAWCFMGHWTIERSSLMLPLGAPLALLAPLLVARYRENLQIRTSIACSILFLWFSITAAVFSYLVVSTNAPLIDDQLARWDHLIGFDWPIAFLWVKQRPFLDSILGFAYSSVLPQIGIVIVYLASTNRQKQLEEFNSVLVITALITIVVSGFFPAVGPFKYYASLVHVDASMLSHFELLRTGTLRSIDLLNVQGLVSIPSFHAIMAILLTYAMRSTRIWPVFFALDIVVIFSIPTRGGHYLIDLIAGAMTVAAVIAFWRMDGVSRVGITRGRFPLRFGSRPQGDR